MRIVAAVSEGALFFPLIEPPARDGFDDFFVLFYQVVLFGTAFNKVIRWDHQVTIPTTDRACPVMELSGLLVIS